MKILLVGGGSGGSVSPLLAVASEIKTKYPKVKFLFVGTSYGPEKVMAEQSGLPFVSITAGKLRRYFSLKNIATPFLVFWGFWESLKILKDFKPDCVFGAGSFVQVPLFFAAWFKKIPIVLHQQDVVPSLANKLCQFLAKKITVTFSASLKGFASSFGVLDKKQKEEKIILTGNPIRQDLKLALKDKAEKDFNLKKDFPTLLILGGGTGAKFLNDLVAKAATGLTKTVQIIHSTGKGKAVTTALENYHSFEFINNIAEAYAAADIVVSRAGLATIAELSALKKLSIIIPMPNSHQEVNALLLIREQAAIVLDQDRLTPENFTNLIRKLLFEFNAQKFIKENMGRIMPHNAAEKISEIIFKLIESK